MPGARNSDVNTGRWTQEEHQAFLDGLDRYGKDWKKIGSLIPTRSIVQIRTHAQKYFVKLSKDRGQYSDQKSKGIPSISSRKQSGVCFSKSRSLSVSSSPTYTDKSPGSAGTPLRSTTQKEHDSPQNDPQNNSHFVFPVEGNDVDTRASAPPFDPEAEHTEGSSKAATDSAAVIIPSEGKKEVSSARFRLNPPSKQEQEEPVVDASSSKPKMASMTTTVKIPMRNTFPKRKRASTDGKLRSDHFPIVKRGRTASFPEGGIEFPASHGETVRYASPLQTNGETDITQDPFDKNLLKPLELDTAEEEDKDGLYDKFDSDFTPHRRPHFNDPIAIGQSSYSPHTEVGAAESAAPEIPLDGIGDDDDAFSVNSVFDFDDDLPNPFDHPDVGPSWLFGDQGIAL